MWIALKLVSIPALLIAASAVGAIGSWGVPVGAVLLLATCVAGAVAMESEDLATTAPAPVARETAPDALFEAA
jgi:hypothetical protein